MEQLDYPIYDNLVDYLNHSEIVNLANTSHGVYHGVKNVMKRCDGCKQNDNLCTRIKYLHYYNDDDNTIYTDDLCVNRDEKIVLIYRVPD